MSENNDPLAEVSAMGKVAEALTGLDEAAVGRVLRWAVDHYGATVTAAKPTLRPPSGGAAIIDNGSVGNGCLHFTEFAELYAAASPESDADKVLVAGYWFQFNEGRQDLTAQEINTALKHLGHPIAHITSAFDTLKARKPQHVMQLRKSGASRQARKTYKLTVAGKQAVEGMVGQQQQV